MPHHGRLITAMKGWLICSVIAASSIAHAATMTANAQEQQRVAVEAKPVSTRSLPAPQSSQSQPASTPPQSVDAAQLRHLSDEERAELRKQLQQFNRQFGKRS